MKKHNIFLGVILALFFGQIFLISLNYFEGTVPLNENNTPINELTRPPERDMPRISDSNITKALNYSSISRNRSVVRRVFQSVNISVNVSGYSSNANFTKMYIRFFDDTIKSFNMTETADGEKFTYTYTPEYTAPLGLAKVNFTIYNATGVESEWTVLNNGTTFTNFTIKSSSLADLNSSVYDRGEYLYAPIMVQEPSEFTWEVSVVKDNKENLFFLGHNLNDTYFEINESFTETSKYYYLAINATQKSSGKWEESYFRFQIQNAVPVIDEDSLKFNPTEIYRTERCVVEVNVTDEESDNIGVSMDLEDPNGQIQTYELDSGNTQEIFKKSFTIEAGKPAGHYNVEIKAEDENSGISTYETSINIKNNPPKVNSYEVNNFTMEEQVNINYGDDLIFKFNVTDKEGLAYVKVALLNEDNEWFNLTREYKDNMRITIRTQDLLSGDWYVYVYVTDTDGKTVGLDFNYDVAPQQISIVPDIMGTILPWIALIIGLALGLIIGIAAGSRLGKRPAKESPTTPKRATKAKPKKKLKSSISTEKKKEVEKKPEPSEAEQETKEEKKERKPKRKIKRKL
ncbi:MAG: hypothetical protein ACOC44_01555 [Promethearchaeia archaeon]